VPAGSTAQAAVIRSTDPARAVLRLARQCDLLIVGPARDQGIFSWLRQSLEDRVADSASCAVVQLKARVDISHPWPLREREDARVSVGLGEVESD
jgi:hypothetical protein